MKANKPNEEAERYHVGTTIAGRYRVERPIGEGAMGAVALALHVGLDEKVAIKFLRPELRRDPVAVARLSREARALARIKSDHVARVIDVGATLAVGPYMVMEYLEGTDLGEVIETEGPLSVERAVEVVLQVCEALTVAHTVGITHRDIKPQNLFLARHGEFETLKLLDFGIAADARVATDPTSGSPSFGRGAAPPYGTPSYMSPERIADDPTADHRCDIWSVGVVLHELVTGRAVFNAPTLIETCARVMSDAPLALETDDAVLPPTLRSIIARCLEREPDRRYQSVEELAVALAPLGTMRERFRGRSTGAFSRKLVEEQLELSKTQRLLQPKPNSLPPMPGELSTLLVDIGAGLRWVVRSIPIPLSSVHARPLGSFAAVALASALLTSIFGGVHWLSPPPVVVMRSEPLAQKEAVARRTDETPAFEFSPPQPSVAPAIAGASTNDTVVSRYAAGSEPEPPPVSSDSEVSRGATPRSGRAKPRRKRKAASPVARASDTREEHAAVHRVLERSSRVRLVGERSAPHRLPKRDALTNGAPAEQRDSAAPALESGPLPEWLQLMRRKPDEP
jgi:serine/threonine protein kinase